MAKSIYREIVTILSGTADKALESQRGHQALAQATAITIFAPATLAETVTLQVSADHNPAGTLYGYHSLQRWTSTGATDVTMTAAKALLLPDVPCAALNFHSTGVVAADRTFIVMISLDV
jgi:hypothetical protein